MGTSRLHPGSVENQTRDLPDPFDEGHLRAADDRGGRSSGGVLADFRGAFWERGESRERRPPEVDPDGQLALFDPPEGTRWPGRSAERNGGL